MMDSGATHTVVASDCPGDSRPEWTFDVVVEEVVRREQVSQVS